MGLKRTGNYTRAALAGLVALLALGYESIMAARLVATGDLQSFLTTGDFVAQAILMAVGLLVALLGNVLLIAAPFTYIRVERRLRGAAEHDARVAPLASVQPDASLALRAGETLVLARRRSGRSTLGLALVPLFAIALMSSHAIGTSLGLLDPASVPVAITALSAAIWLLLGAMTQRERLVADDQGITLQQSLRRRRFIPWDDILVFFVTPDSTNATPYGWYQLWGRGHGLTIGIHGRITDESPSYYWTWSTVFLQVLLTVLNPYLYHYQGGYDAYEANARRLLATITTRSHLPLRTAARATRPRELPTGAHGQSGA